MSDDRRPLPTAADIDRLEKSLMYLLDVLPSNEARTHEWRRLKGACLDAVCSRHPEQKQQQQQQQQQQQPGVSFATAEHGDGNDGDGGGDGDGDGDDYDDDEPIDMTDVRAAQAELDELVQGAGKPEAMEELRELSESLASMLERANAERADVAVKQGIKDVHEQLRGAWPVMQQQHNNASASAGGGGGDYRAPQGDHRAPQGDGPVY